MKIIETRPREIDFVLWGHCQNLLDDPRKLEKNDKSYGVKKHPPITSQLYFKSQTVPVLHNVSTKTKFDIRV